MELLEAADSLAFRVCVQSSYWFWRLGRGQGLTEFGLPVPLVCHRLFNNHLVTLVFSVLRTLSAAGGSLWIWLDLDGEGAELIVHQFPMCSDRASCSLTNSLGLLIKQIEKQEVWRIANAKRNWQFLYCWLICEIIALACNLRWRTKWVLHGL